MREQTEKTTFSCKDDYYIGVWSRDLFIDEAHMTLDIFPACCLVRFAALFPVVSAKIVYWKIRFPGNFKFYPHTAINFENYIPSMNTQKIMGLKKFLAIKEFRSKNF